MISSPPVNQVKQLLADDPGNSEYADMERELNEVILFRTFSFLVCIAWICTVKLSGKIMRFCCVISRVNL